MAAKPPPPGEDHTVYGGEEEDLDDEEEDDEEDQNDDVVDEDDEDVDVDVDDDSTSSSNIAAPDMPPPPVSAGEVTIAVAGVPATPEPKRLLIEDASIASTVVSEKKPLPLPLDESRRLFQRLWTDEDEIELLQGFLDYTSHRGVNNSSSSHHHDTTAFYDQIKCRLQLDFNKNQLVEKLRRLKKKYRNVVSKLSSGKDYIFKSPHDQATFEISKKIWSGAATITAGGSGGVGGEFDEDEGNPNPKLNFNISNPVLNDHNINGGVDVNNNNYSNSSEKKVARPRKRSRGGVKIEEKQQHTLIDQLPPVVATPMGSIPNLIEDTVRSCLSPLFKELLNNAVNGPCGSRGGFGGVTLNSMMMPMGFGGGSLNFAGGGEVDEKWRKQQILELEVYLKRLELVQDQIKSQLEELRSMGS